MEQINIVEFPVSNYYGRPYVIFNEEDCKYYMCLNDYDELVMEEISEEFYNACKKEFNNNL